LNAAVAAAVLPGINEATLILTVGTLAAAVEIELAAATATKLAPATTAPPMRMDVLALVLNLITFPFPSLGTALRPNLLRVERGPVCGLDKPDRGVLRQRVADKL
jgi:hypothetical protein